MVSSNRYDQFGQKRGRIIDNVYHLSSVVKYGLDRLVGFLPIFLEGQRARSARGTFIHARDHARGQRADASDPFIPCDTSILAEGRRDLFRTGGLRRGRAFVAALALFPARFAA